jgi:hypothetical protein
VAHLPDAAQRTSAGDCGYFGVFEGGFGVIYPKLLKPYAAVTYSNTKHS